MQKKYNSFILGLEKCCNVNIYSQKSNSPPNVGKLSFQKCIVAARSGRWALGHLPLLRDDDRPGDHAGPVDVVLQVRLELHVLHDLPGCCCFESSRREEERGGVMFQATCLPNLFPLPIFFAEYVQQ